MLTLLLHNIPEGIVTFTSSLTNKNLGLKLSLAIMAHNIPEGICISVPIYYSTKSRWVAFKNTLISALAEPFGAIITYLFLYKYINNYILNIILYFIGCLMILICIKEILPEILKNNERKYILYGILVSLFILFI
jgi:ZIP family zinc transporter